MLALIILLFACGIPTLLVVYWIRRSERKDYPTVSPAFMQGFNSGRDMATLFKPKKDLHTQYWGPGGVRDRVAERLAEGPHGWPEEPK